MNRAAKIKTKILALRTQKSICLTPQEVEISRLYKRLQRAQSIAKRMQREMYRIKSNAGYEAEKKYLSKITELQAQLNDLRRKQRSEIKSEQMDKLRSEYREYQLQTTAQMRKLLDRFMPEANGEYPHHLFSH